MQHLKLALCAVLPRLQHPPGIPARDLCKITTHHNAYHLIQLMVVNSWRLVYAFVAAKHFHRSHAESSLTRMIFFKKSTYLLVCPSLTILSRIKPSKYSKADMVLVNSRQSTRFWAPPFLLHWNITCSNTTCVMHMRDREDSKSIPCRI